MAMLACVGWMVSEFVHLPDPQFQNPNQLQAMMQVHWGGWVQIIAFTSLYEILTLEKMFDGERDAADLDFDPIGLDTPRMRLAEVKHGRLAMLGIRTFRKQAARATGQSVCRQSGGRVPLVSIGLDTRD